MTDSVAAASPAEHGGAPPPPRRRPRTREVSSRFMAPARTSISSASDHALTMNSIATPAPPRWSSSSSSQRRPFSSTSRGNIPQVRSSRRPTTLPLPKLSASTVRGRSTEHPARNRYLSIPKLSTSTVRSGSTEHSAGSMVLDHVLAQNTQPPRPARTKLGVGSRKGKKPDYSQPDVHSLELLRNRYLQFRFANAKAQASMHAQRTKMENQVFSLGADISHLRDNVKNKQAELARLQRTKALPSILDAQMPYLDEWSAVEEDYTRSLSGTINVLSNSLLRLHVNGNFQVNVKDAAEALDSAVKTADMIVHQMQIFLSKVEELDGLMSELASIIDVEKALVEECGNLLAKTHRLHVEDCSLRGHLMQVASSYTLADDAFVLHKSRS